MSKVNVMTKEKDEEQLADILLFTVAIKSLVTYGKGEEKFISSGQGEEGRELCSRVTDCSKGLKEGTGLQPDMQLQMQAKQLSHLVIMVHNKNQNTLQLVFCCAQ